MIGRHADFISGWNTSVLAATIKTCSATLVGDPAACAALAPFVSANKKTYGNCAYAGVLPTEDVGVTGNLLAALPGQGLNGCSPNWSAPSSWLSNKLPVSRAANCPIAGAVTLK